MKFTILSDLHIDFWLRPKTRYKEERLRSIFDNVLDPSEDVEVLIVAGDISHYNSQFSVLELLADIYNYKKVFCVLGNHDLYLITDSQRHRHGNSSKQRQAEWYAQQTDTIRILDGVVETYDGVKIGGAMSWYDGTFNAPHGYSYRDPVSIWKHTMNDYHNIKGYEDFYEIYEQERPKVERILDADIIITHVCPLSHRIAFQEMYQHELSNMFYAFDGETLLEQTNAQFWIYGHSHGQHEFEIYDTQCVMNSQGYPSEGGAKLLNKEIHI